MNKSELVATLAQKKNLSFLKAENIINTIFESMADTLIAGGRIEIRGFGSFVVKEYDAYIGRNPKTGIPIKVEPKRLPFFKVGKDIKGRVSGT
jgi:integration host factor subunit beta